MDAKLSIDERALEEFRDKLFRRGQSLGRWLTLRFCQSLLIALVFVFFIIPLIAGRLPGRADVTGAALVVRLTGALVLALFSTGMAYRQVRDTLRLSLVEHRKLLEREFGKWVGPGLLWRTLAAGLLLTAGVGVPVGVLVALTSPAPELPAGSRPLMLLFFVGFTALWALPFAFGLRWLVLWQYRRWGVVGKGTGRQPGEQR
jgi:hypothetical protein